MTFMNSKTGKLYSQNFFKKIASHWQNSKRQTSESQSSEEEDTRTAIPFGNIDDEIFMLPGIEQVAHFTIDAVSNRLNNGNKISYYLK
jgi:hypothetical protein